MGLISQVLRVRAKKERGGKMLEKNPLFDGTTPRHMLPVNRMARIVARARATKKTKTVWGGGTHAGACLDTDRVSRVTFG